MEKLIIANQKGCSFDSDDYEEIFSVDIATTCADDYMEVMCDIVNAMQTGGITDLLLVADNELYEILAMIMNVIKKQFDISDLRVFILPEYSVKESRGRP